MRRVAIAALLVSCGAPDQEPWPMYFCPEMPAADAERWSQAAFEWESMVGGDLFDQRRGEAPEGDCPLVVCTLAPNDELDGRYDRSACPLRAVAVSGAGAEAHELGHALSLPDGGDGCMGSGARVTMQEAAAVRVLLGLD